MLKRLLPALVLSALLMTGCKESTPPEITPDAGQVDVIVDLHVEDEEDAVATPLPTVVNLAPAAGVGQSESYRMRFILASPVQLRAASSESYQVVPGPAVLRESP